ncbi:MAG: hypothetical protein K0S32_4286 [Bacteroidetes bacterium]|jgi:hypothetical protein|nr:hypothetical protein [Bacteroidota bacterium]
MKKVMSIIAVALFTATFVSCGPSAEEKAKMEERAKVVADSIANAISASMNAATTETVAAPADSVPATTPTTEAH